MSLRVCIFQSDKPRERYLSDALAAGFRRHGDTVEVRPLNGEAQVAEGCDLVTMVGVKSKRLFDANWKAGIHTMMLDKGYVRTPAEGGVKGWKYWRVAIDGHHPTHYLPKMKMGPERWRALRLEMKPWRKEGRQIVFAGSSEKYHQFYEMDNPTQFAEKYIFRLRKDGTKREIIYRPKPSWDDATPIHGSTFSFEKGTSILDVLKGAHVLITHGSNAVFEAVLEGVPCICMGQAVARPISSTEIEEYETPRLASDKERLQWVSNLAYCQWTLAEMESGEAWEHTKSQLISHCA